MLLKKSFCDHMLNFSCVLSPVTYRRYEGIARTTGNLAQTALRGTRTVSDCTSTSRKNSKKNCRCLVSDFFNSIGQKFPFEATLGNVRFSNKRTFAIGLTKSRASPEAVVPKAVHRFWYEWKI